jgi:precorrin-2 dehydrogenase/sirohydrochlorin ferrochelatase
VAQLFPAFLKLEGRTVLVVGAGKVGESKIASLLDSGARIRVVALEAGAATLEWAKAGAIVLHQRAFISSDLDGVFLAVVATRSRELNQFVFDQARLRGVLCNVVDVPQQCDFFYPAVVRRGDLQIAVSTAGQSPFLAQRIRQQLERQFGPQYAPWVKELGETRRRILSSELSPERKRDLLQSLTSAEAFEDAMEAEERTKEGVVL